ncbi:MAG: aminoacyl-tRNA hydrolase, partial [Kiritimatiellae bacterium]|nr:aminoacyl-tRNA hydrolase [Kiritimatiellia bacterium]
MKIVVGLGNPGAQYTDTPHSVGFEAVDAIAAEIGASWEPKKAFRCLMARGVFAGVDVMLVKPQTFMNLSGDSVAPVVKYNNATPA